MVEKRLPPQFLQQNILAQSPHNRDDMDDPECIWQIISLSGNTKFQIKFHGEIYAIDDEKLIVDTNRNKALIHAYDPLSGEEIILFDGSEHGYDNLFNLKYSKRHKYTKRIGQDRPLSEIYTDINGNSLFEVLMIFYHNIDDYEDEFDGAEFVKTVKGRKMTLADLASDGFDAVAMILIDENGNRFEAMQFELA